MVNDSDVAMRVQPHAGTSDRRDFIVRAAGLSLGLLGTALPTTDRSRRPGRHADG